MSAPVARHRLALDERRAQLLELGARLFSERAYDDVSIDDIAEAAGISKGLLYHYFGSKRAFYVATVRQAAQQLQLRTEPDASLPQPSRARAGLDGYLSFVEEHAAPYASLMRSGIGNDPEVAAIVDETRDAIVKRMMDELGLSEPRPVVRFALRSWIGLVEAASLDWLDRREVAREAVLQMLLESLYSTLVIASRLDPDAPISVGAPPQAVSDASAVIETGETERKARPRRR
ncbi:TetR/AcrR family transcriptional regulator [Sandaracinus amylolyticus]|nr:TetR/AcrR family transcriptional regulator [Sandaracinus amylolyticus]